MASDAMRRRYGLPKRLFLYTVDQLGYMLDVSNVDSYLHKEGVSIGIPPRDKMLARNIAPSDMQPEWRVEEDEFVRWLRTNGITTVRMR